MTAPDQATKPSETILRERGHPYMVFLELFAAGADIKVAFWIEGEVAAGEGSVRALCLVDQVHVRFDPALVHQSPDHLGRAVAPIRDQARRRDAELFSRAVEHFLAAPISAKARRKPKRPRVRARAKQFTNGQATVHFFVARALRRINGARSESPTTRSERRDRCMGSNARAAIWPFANTDAAACGDSALGGPNLTSLPPEKFS